MTDIQVGHEKSLTAVVPALAGANIIFGMGMLELGVTFSFEQLVIDDMVVGDVKKLLKSDLGKHNISDPERLVYLMRKGFPSEYWSPHRVRGREFNRERFDPVLKRKNIVQEAQQKVQEILTRHIPEPLSPSVKQKIREIILETEERKSAWKRGVPLD